MLNIIFKDESLEEIYQYGTTKDKRYRKLCRNNSFVMAFQRVIRTMEGVENTSKLSDFSYLHYEKLKHRGQSSVRIKNDMVERLLFTETEDGLEIELIEIDRNHYGKKK